MSNLHRDGYAYTPKDITAEGRQHIKLSADAPKLVIGIPIRATINEVCEDGSLVTTGRTISPEFMFSLLQNVTPINVTAKYRVVRGMMGGPARDSIVEYAIAQGAKYIMFLDDDVLFPDYTIGRMHKNMEMYPDIGVMTGVYCTNKIGYSEPLIYKNYGEGAFWDWEMDELIDIYACGAGCMMIRVDALKAMPRPWFYEGITKIGENKTVVGHDVMVCRKMWEKTNYRVVVDTGILCGHIDIHRGITHILPKDAPAYRNSKHKRYFSTELVDGSLFWSEHLAEEQVVEPQVYKKKLLAFTTCKDFDRVKEAVRSVKDDSWDKVIIDDGTADTTDIAKFCEDETIHLIKKRNAKGLTDSWNLAYRKFKDEGYDVCCLSNDDVLFAPRALQNMEVELASNGFIAVGPLSNNPGHQPLQYVGRHITQSRPSKDLDSIEGELTQRGHDSESMTYLNGFCFMWDKRMKGNEHSEGYLFNPANTNVGNEDDLFGRTSKAGQKVGLVTNSYVYHEKAVVLNQDTDIGRNKIWTESKHE